MTHISDPHFAERVRASFDKQNAMHLVKASLPVVEHGMTEIHVPHWSGIEQQHGFVHGGVVGMIADSAAGYAAMSMVPASASVLTVEYKMNLLAPADGEKLIARGQVVLARADPDRHQGRSLCGEGRQGDPLCADAADHHGHARQGGKVAPRPLCRHAPSCVPTTHFSRHISQ